MINAEFDLVKQILNVGYYAGVSLEVTRDPAVKRLAVEFDECADVEFRGAAFFGLEYAFEDLPRELRFSEGLRAKVTAIRWAPVDTTSVLVAYAAAHALWKALGHQPQRPILLESERRGVFFPR